MRRIEPFGSGFCAFDDGPEGASLIGWYNTERAAKRALDAKLGVGGGLGVLPAILANVTAVLAVAHGRRAGWPIP